MTDEFVLESGIYALNKFEELSSLLCSCIPDTVYRRPRAYAVGLFGFGHISVNGMVIWDHAYRAEMGSTAIRPNSGTTFTIPDQCNEMGSAAILLRLIFC